jgi:MFS family permease
MTAVESRLPPFVREVTDDRRGLRTLLVVVVAILAAALDPPLLDPGMPTIRAALRAEPSLQAILSLSTEVQAAFLLIGGVVADRWRTRRTLQLGLAGLVLGCALAVLMPSGPGLLASRVVGWASSGVVIPFSIGAVAVVYTGTARATALGIAYAAMGAGTAAAPALVVLLGVQGPRWPAFAACAAAALIAIPVVGRYLPDLPRDKSWPVAAIFAVVLLGVGVVSVVSALVQIGEALNPIRLGSLTVGVLAIAASFWLRHRATEEHRTLHFDYRPLAVAIVAGLIVGFSQAIPLLQVPQYFQLILGMPPLVATLAIAPFVIALFVAGPLSGVLLQRYSPRVLMAGGTIALGIADVIVAVVLGPATSSSYLYYIVPLALIGGGFVLATTVRTAVIFASMPSRLPALAAGINGASIGVGARLGIVVATVVVSRVALDAYSAEVTNLNPVTAAALVEQFREFLTALGLSGTTVVGGLDASTFVAYAVAGIQAIRITELISGVVAIVGGIFIYFAMGPRSPLVTVFDMAEERQPKPSQGTAAAPSDLG